MEGLTYFEIGRKHGIPQSDISVAVTNSGIEPVGTKHIPTCKRAIKTWNEQEVVKAVRGMWQHRANELYARARAWEEKAAQL